MEIPFITDSRKTLKIISNKAGYFFRILTRQGKHTPGGKYDYVIAIMAKDMKEFDDVFHAFKTRFEKIIKDYDIALIIEEYKLDYLIDLIKG